MAKVKGGSRWWGEFRLAEGETGLWRVGPLALWVSRTGYDWRYGAESSENSLEDTLEVHVPWESDGEEHTLPEEQGRFGVARTEATIELVPALGDRPVVARPAVPFFVPPGQKIELFVSTPLWIQLRVDQAGLAEVPCVRPSDTWFGGNTRGELCYATRTHLRRQVEDLALRPHRAISCVTVENESKNILALERLCLPTPQLSLFASPAGSLWTEHVSIRNDDDGDLSEVSLGKGPPRVAKGGELIAPPRSPQGPSFASLVFGGLFEVGT